MNKLRNDFREIFLEVEGVDADLEIVWPEERKICYPKFVSKKLKTKNEKKLEPPIVTESHVASSAVESENLLKTETDYDDDMKLQHLKSENLKNLQSKELADLKENVSLEILWIQQAIQSRIQVRLIVKSLFIPIRFVLIFF